MTGWRANLGFIWMGTFVGLLGANFVFPFLPFYIEKLGVEDEGRVAFWTGLMGSATGLTLTLTAPIWGVMADKFGRKPMFVRALVGAGILIGLMGLAQSVWHLLILRAGMGLFAGTMGAAAALVAATTPRRHVGNALGILQTGVFSANMLGPVLGGVAATIFGLRGSFFACAVLYVIAAGLAIIFVKESIDNSAEDEEPAEALAAKKKSDGGLVANLRVVTKERQILIILLVLFALWLSTTFVRPVMPLSIDSFAFAGTGGEDDLHVHVELQMFSFDVSREAATGVVFGVLGATSTIAALVVGPLGARIGYGKTVAIAAVGGGLLYIPVALAGTFTSYMLAFAAVGLFQGAMVPGTNALIAAATPRGSEGSAFGLAASMQSLALLVGPLGGGVLADLVGIKSVYLSLVLILFAAAAAVLLMVREPRKDENEPLGEATAGASG